MELLKEILVHVLEKEQITITLGDIIEMESYNALQKIKAIIDNDNLSDFDCVEEIICVFESMGSTGGSRHDFG